jgi:hypothetical protein
MKIKKYDDNTINIQYEIGDYVKIKHNPKFGNPDDKEDKFGKIIKVVGKPLTAKLIISTDKGNIESFVWNVKPADEDGNILNKEEIIEQSKVVEKLDFNLNIINDNNKKIIKFSEI